MARSILTRPGLIIRNGDILNTAKMVKLVVGFDPSFPYKGGKGQGEGRYVYKTGTGTDRTGTGGKFEGR